MLFAEVSPFKIETIWKQELFPASSYQQCLSYKCVMSEKTEKKYNQPFHFLRFQIHKLNQPWIQNIWGKKLVLY